METHSVFGKPASLSGPSSRSSGISRHLGIRELRDRRLLHSEIAEQLNMTRIAVGHQLRIMGEVRRQPRVTAAQLEEMRLDVAWEARPENRGIVPANRIVCRECGELLHDISGKHSHIRLKHHWEMDEYKSKYPGARLKTFARSEEQNRREGGTKTAEDLMDEFAAMYVTGKELVECHADPQWEKHHGFTAFIVCRVCGLKSKNALYNKAGLRHHHHLKQHGLTSDAYLARFPGCELRPQYLKDAAKLKLAAAWRPDDWWDEDKADWRIIGNELLSRPGYMSNEELGRRLDQSQLSCKYGDCWETALTRNRTAINYVWKIRTWVRRSARNARKK